MATERGYPSGSGPSMAVVGEPEVLPVFYYNDLLIDRIGGTIGLNLFEPRYIAMCERMRYQPRFLFMPNYTDYLAQMGDVGFVVKVTSLTAHAGGRTRGIQGAAEALVAVACTWVEPNSCGLHYAKYWRLRPDAPCIAPTESHSFLMHLGERGWHKDERNHDARCLLHHPDFESAGMRLLFGFNWPDRVFVMAPPATRADGRQPALIERHMREAWASACPRSRLSGEAFVEAAVQRVPMGPRDVAGPTLRRLADDVVDLIQEERGAGAAAPALKQAQWWDLLAPARIACVGGMVASLQTVRLVLLDLPGCAIMECFPRAQINAAAFKLSVGATNHTNVSFCCMLQDVTITGASADATLRRLRWRLSKGRVALLRRAHARRQGPLARLEECVLQQVCDFVAVKPSAGNTLYLDFVGLGRLSGGGG